MNAPFIANLEKLSGIEFCRVMEMNAARQYIDCVNWSEFPYKPVAAFDIAWSATHIFIRYFVRGEGLKAINTENNSQVSNDSCVEFFVKRAGSPRYYSFEFNCIGTCLARSRTRPEDKKFLSDEQIGRIIVRPSLGLKPFDERGGIAQWELTVGIPFDIIGVDPAAVPSVLMANFQKCAEQTASRHYLSWSPILTPQPDFHRPEFFGELHLVGR